jgi:hypothetical protein
MIAAMSIFRGNIGSIAERLARRGVKSRTLDTYKSRINRLLRDYDRDGKRIMQTKAIASAQNDAAKSLRLFSGGTKYIAPHRIELTLRGNTKFILIVPQDINKAEVEKMKKVLDSLVAE